jgi:hypothetical protein
MEAMEKLNKYVSFVSDMHFLSCIDNLFAAYVKAKNSITKNRFYSNKVDTIKLLIDSKFNGIDEDSLIQSEVIRQIDKAVNNSIGTFHEQILGGIEGFELGYLSGYDIKSKDNCLFADIKNKHNTANSSSLEALFQKLARYADDNKNAKCYWVQILAKASFCQLWAGQINGKEYSHSRVYKISGDKFYELLTGQKDAMLQLYNALPFAIDDYLESIKSHSTFTENSVLDELKTETSKTGRSIIDQITYDNYRYYHGFDGL